MSTLFDESKPFQRTSLTWQAYFTIGFYSYLLNSLGPLTPFLRGEMHLSYTAASFHFSALAIGIITAGLLLNRVVQRFGVKKMVWAGVIGMAAGTLMLILGRSPWVTIPGAFIMGLLGVLISALLSSALAEQHGPFRAVALTESTMIASLLSTCAPVAISFFGRTGLTWRAALGSMLLAVPILWFFFGRNPIPGDNEAEKAAAPARTKAPLPFRYWLYWALILLVEAIEFCISFWASDYLETVNGFSKSNAALGLSVFMGSMLAGRWIVSRLLRRSQEQKLLLGSMLTAAAGFLLFWVSSGVWLPLTGLMLAGLGIAGQYPIVNSLALATVPDRMVEGSVKSQLAVGLAIFSLPLALARLADQFGIRTAYGLELGLLFLAFVIAVRAGKKKAW